MTFLVMYIFEKIIELFLMAPYMVPLRRYIASPRRLNQPCY